MIHEQPCGGYKVLDRFEKREIQLLQAALILAQDVSKHTALRSDYVALEDKIFGASDSFLDDIEQLLTK